MKRYYKANRTCDWDDDFDDTEERFGPQVTTTYYVYDTTTRIIDEYGNNLYTNPSPGKYAKTLNMFYNNAQEYICRIGIYNTDDVTEISKEDMETELFVDRI